MQKSLWQIIQYDFPIPGKYTVIVTRDFEVGSFPFIFRAVSNALTINLAPVEVDKQKPLKSIIRH